MRNNFTEFLLKHLGIFLYFTLSNIFCLALYAYKNISVNILDILKYIKTTSLTLVFTLLFIFLFVYLINKRIDLKFSYGGGDFKTFNIL